jgi:N utilization substance protein A
VRWNESSQILIANALKPAEVAEVALCFELGRATVVVDDSQLSLAIGKRGQNVRLAARLTGWDIDILTPPEFQAGVQRLGATLLTIEGITQEMVDKVVALGLIDVRDMEEVGTGPLMEEIGLSEATAQQVVDRCMKKPRSWRSSRKPRSPRMPPLRPRIRRRCWRWVRRRRVSRKQTSR